MRGKSRFACLWFYGWEGGNIQGDSVINPAGLRDATSRQVNSRDFIMNLRNVLADKMIYDYGWLDLPPGRLLF